MNTSILKVPTISSQLYGSVESRYRGKLTINGRDTYTRLCRSEDQAKAELATLVKFAAKKDPLCDFLLAR